MRSVYASHRFVTPRNGGIDQFAPALREGLHTALAALGRWQRRAQDRQDLRKLSDRELRDIGVDWIGAQQEAAKPFWRA